MNREGPQRGDDMRGKTVVITGANNRLGFEAAKQLAMMGSSVVMVCRDAARGRAAQKEIGRVATGAAPALLLADLSSQTPVRSLVAAEESRGRPAELQAR